jgi:hypothetical protein
LALFMGNRITVKRLDRFHRIRVYDGRLNDEDWQIPIPVPMGMPQWHLTLAEIDRQDFRHLKAPLGEENFQAIVQTQGYLPPSMQGASYQGSDGLPLHYAIRETPQPQIRALILIGFGEFQPGRWLAQVEGVWHIIEGESKKIPRLKPGN